VLSHSSGEQKSKTSMTWPKSKCPQDCLSSRGSRGEYIPLSFLLLVAGGLPLLVVHHFNFFYCGFMSISFSAYSFAFPFKRCMTAFSIWGPTLLFRIILPYQELYLIIFANIFSFFIIHLFTCAYIVWVISPPCLPPPPSLFSPLPLPGRTILLLSLILLKRRHKHSKKDKAFC
jgi:hypothetical protein